MTTLFIWAQNALHCSGSGGVAWKEALFILTLTQLSWSLILQGEVGFSFAGSLSDRYPAADRAAVDCAAVEALCCTLPLRGGAKG